MQVASFAASCALGASPAGLALLALSAVALCLTLHVTAHEAAHHGRGKWRSLLTALIGLPFHGYVLHHANHHRHANSLDDWSSTWRPGPSGPRPANPWSYSLGWPLALLRARAEILSEKRSGRLPRSVVRGLAADHAVLLIVVASLAITSWRHALAWLVTIHVGWALVSLHNYGQHPPREYGSGLTKSVHSRLYNALTCNNGLHHEHHGASELPWRQLAPDPAAPRARLPHVLDALVRP